jgi:uncharacterized membrane protein/predicted DsbA family dithiol-disulfide isomerase
VRAWRVAFLVLCTIAVCLSADLLRLHINVHTDPHYQSYCAMSERVNCETVALSDYAVLLGMPLAVWGLFVYMAMAALAIWGLRSRLRTPSWPFGALFWSSAFASVVGVALYAISHFLIESVCLVCAGTYATNLLLLGTAWMALRRCNTSPAAALAEDARAAAASPRAVLLLAGSATALLVATWVGMPRYWRVQVAPRQPAGLATGATQEGHPWIGAARPVLQIVEFSDYQCPYCQRGHDEIRKLIAEEPGRVRLVHRNYPLDHRCNAALRRPFHSEACRYALLAHCAQRQDGFWAANDYLFTHGRRREPVTVEELAAAVQISASALSECVDSEAAAGAIQADLAAGRALKIRGTPTFVVGEQTYPGRIPNDVIRHALGDSPDTNEPPQKGPGQE